MKYGGSIEINFQSGIKPDIELFISNTKAYSDGFKKIGNHEISEMETSTGYMVTFNKLHLLGLTENGRMLRITSTVDNLWIEVTLIDAFEFIKGVKAPILYRINGDAGDFFLSNFSPSFGLNLIQTNFITRKFEYISMDAIVSVALNQETGNTYSFIVGGDIDFGGWVQLGTAYHFKEDKLLFLIGIRPETWISENFKKLVR